MIKVAALYGYPTNPETFEAYYASTHMPLVATIKQLARSETTKFLPDPDGSPAAFYRMAGLYFNSGEDLQQALSPAQVQADFQNIFS